MKIFIQVASYRDPQLIPTIQSALENAKRPENLVFGIARQYHPDDNFDNLDEYRNDKRFRIIDIPYTESKGACWQDIKYNKCMIRKVTLFKLTHT